MNNFFKADFHIHSKYSNSVSKFSTIEILSAWAKIKGLDIIGTGDFTHPLWFKEIKNKLVEDKKTGLLKIKSPENINIFSDFSINNKNTLFILTTEISCVYKKNGKTRKIHHLIFAPNIKTAEKIKDKLSKIGNINYDGRPVLGLDSKHLLEIVLESSPQSFLVPAHIWTPWFSIFGSQSGFDSIEECFEELSEHIFALETGLSSDPNMNFLVSKLDKYTLISNSDAHSPEKLGRECNIFSGEISYQNIFNAIKNHKVVSTIEFFPEEGKYHLSGHRKCGFKVNPNEKQEICPVCGGKLTQGVLQRIYEFADRPKPLNPNKNFSFINGIPLKELISEIISKGVNTKSVNTVYFDIIKKMKNEINVLFFANEKELSKINNTKIKKAILNIRKNKVKKICGYDGVFGKIKALT